MSVTLSPIAPRYAVSDADDPFKKYWWVVLLGFAFTGLWLLMPMMGEKAIGSTSVNPVQPKTDDGAEQSFGAEDAGSGIDLSMDGTGARKKDAAAGMGSSLYVPLDGEELSDEKAGATAASASVGGGTLAGALKKVAAGDGGWGEKKAQKGFTVPKLAGGSLSGMGAAGGGKAGSAGGGSGAFGSKNAQIGFGTTKSLTDGPDAKADPSKGLAALRSAAAAAQSAAGNRSNDGASSSLRQAFDGSKGGSQIAGGGTALGGTYEALDTAPINLKLADPKLNEKKLEPPPGADVGQSDMDDSEFAKQLAMQMVGIVIGGAIGGVAGGIVTQVITQAIQRQADQEAKVRELEDKQRLENAKRRMGGATGG